jgi:type II secretory pathway predicted ATPase ExeA
MLIKYEYYSKFNWDSNPFTLTISPELMVGYPQQTESLLTHIFNLHKFAIIIGPTGSGKTTLLMWLRSQLMAYKKFFPHYISKPPKSSKNLIYIIKSILGFNLLDRLRQKNLSIFDLPKFASRKLRNKYLVLLVDEAHESSLTNLEWFRTIVDSVPNLSIVFAGLPPFENKLETRLPTLSMRVTTKTYLNTLTKPETESLIIKRIENVGGEGSKPFTSGAIERIFEITGGFPREVIKTCDILVLESAKKNISGINRDFVDEVIGQKDVNPLKLKVAFSKKQKTILNILNENPNLTPSEIVEYISYVDYKSRNNAVRSINNILTRLLKDEILQRKKLGNSYVYSLSGKARSMFAEA